MKSFKKLKEDQRLNIIESGPEGLACGIHLNGKKNKPILVIASWAGGWDHCSVSYKNRTPTWDEMCQVKDIFFEPEEAATQYHPPHSEYINIHNHCLHLWRKHGEQPVMPPKVMV